MRKLFRRALGEATSVAGGALRAIQQTVDGEALATKAHPVAQARSFFVSECQRVCLELEQARQASVELIQTSHLAPRGTKQPSWDDGGGEWRVAFVSEQPAEAAWCKQLIASHKVGEPRSTLARLGPRAPTYHATPRPAPLVSTLPAPAPLGPHPRRATPRLAPPPPRRRLLPAPVCRLAAAAPIARRPTPRAPPARGLVLASKPKAHLTDRTNLPTLTR